MRRPHQIFQISYKSSLSLGASPILKLITTSQSSNIKTRLLLCPGAYKVMTKCPETDAGTRLLTPWIRTLQPWPSSLTVLQPKKYLSVSKPLLKCIWNLFLSPVSAVLHSCDFYAWISRSSPQAQSNTAPETACTFPQEPLVSLFFSLSLLLTHIHDYAIRKTIPTSVNLLTFTSVPGCCPVLITDRWHT